MFRFDLNRPFGAAAGGRPQWQTWLAMAASLIVGVTLFILAASLALILIPLVLIGGAIAAWRIRSRLKAAGFGPPDPFAGQRRADPRVDVIDVEYRVIDQNEPPRR
jgi:hypothetical protein